MTAESRVSNDDLYASLEELITTHGLTFEQFETLGALDDLYSVNPDLDYAYKAIWPLVRDRHSTGV